MPLSDPPLVPTPGEGRDLLRRELLDPDYHRGDVIQRLLAALGRFIDGTLSAAAGASALSVFAAMAIGLVLVLALIWLASRARSTPRPAAGAGALLPDSSLTAREWRDRAEAALTQEDHSAALVDGFRALVARQIERGRLDAAPGTTAHEVTTAMRSTYPDRAAQMSEGARLFDLVLYGERSATREQAELVLALDDELAGAR